MSPFVVLREAGSRLGRLPPEDEAMLLLLVGDEKAADDLLQNWADTGSPRVLQEDGKWRPLQYLRCPPRAVDPADAPQEAESAKAHRGAHVAQLVREVRPEVSSTGIIANRRRAIGHPLLWRQQISARLEQKLATADNREDENW